MADTNESNDQQHFLETLALHAGAYPDPTIGAMLTPIYQTTTYRQEAVGVDKGYTYSRARNPTVSALERPLAALEGAEFATCFSTGLAATTALFLGLLNFFVITFFSFKLTTVNFGYLPHCPKSWRESSYLWLENKEF